MRSRNLVDATAPGPPARSKDVVIKTHFGRSDWATTFNRVMPMFPARFCALLSVLLAAAPAQAEPADKYEIFSSGDRRVVLIELFTSEGCSSCPPADRWLSGLKSDPGLWGSFVPVAFHVDYWDYIGWTDRFAKAEFSDRQRRHAREGGARAVYTPGFFSQGKDWRGRHQGKLPDIEIAEIGEPGIGELIVRLGDDAATIHFDSRDSRHDRLSATVAILGMALETRVRAGENKGRKLGHDFVVLDIVTIPLEESAAGYTAVTRLPDVPPDIGNLALATWVSKAGSLTPIQAVGGYLRTGLTRAKTHRDPGEILD